MESINFSDVNEIKQLKYVTSDNKGQTIIDIKTNEHLFTYMKNISKDNVLLNNNYDVYDIFKCFNFGNKQNLFDINNKKFISNCWFDEINKRCLNKDTLTENKILIDVKLNGKYNLINLKGELILNNWVDRIISYNGTKGYVYVVINNQIERINL